MEKTEAFRRLEEDSTAIAAQLDGDLSSRCARRSLACSDPLGASLPNFTAFAVYSEFHAFDHATRTAMVRPIGWDLSNFTPGRRTPRDGWAEFKGYHRGLR